MSASMSFNVLASSAVDIVSADELDDVTLQEVPEDLEEPDSATEETESIIEETEAAEEAESVPDETEFTEEVTEEIPEEIAEAIEAAPFNEEAEVDGVIVSVSADEGVFPEDAYMNVERVEDTEDSDALIEETLDDDVNIAHSMTFDITIYDSEGNEIEPDTEAGNVYVSFSDSLVADSNLDVDVYHITDEEEAIALDVNVEDELVVAETDGFSYYVLVFSYETETYNLSRATTVTANEIARSVGLPEGDVSNVIVADGSHINASQTSGIWLISENGSFDGTEIVGFVIGGVTYDVEISTNNEATQRATSDTMGFGIGNRGTILNYGFNVWGIDGSGNPITTTYDKMGAFAEGSGYRIIMSVDSTDTSSSNVFTDFSFGKTYTRGGVEAYVTAELSQDGQAVLVTYTMTNTNDVDSTVYIGSFTDCQIGKYDHSGGADGAQVIAYGNGLSMSYNGNTFYLLPGNGSFSTRWTGFGSIDIAQSNVFTNSINTAVNNNDRYLAWSWNLNIPAGETRTRVAIFGVGSDLSTTTVNFDANGGTGSIDPITILDGVQSNLPANTITPPPGGVFSGWATSDNGPVIYPDMGSILADDSMESSITLYAVWQPNAEFTTAPTLNSGLVYDGNEKVLIQPGETAQGDIQYSLDGNTWTDNYEDIVATNAGTYRVYYKIIGDDAHTDSAVAYFDVTIEPATLTLIIDDATKVMGQLDPTTYTATITGEINPGDAASIEYDISRSDTGEAAGTYVLSATVTESTVPANYTVVIQTGTLTIIAVSPTVVDDLTYNGQAQELVTSPDPADFPDGCDEIWYSVDGGTWSQTATSADAGDHVIAFEFRNSNTGASVDGGTVYVSIERAAVTLTADNAGKTFGEDDPANFTASITAGSLYGTDTLDYSVSREAGESAGEYDIDISLGTNNNYNVTVVSGTFTIARAAVDPDDLPANSKPTAIGSLVYTGGDQELINEPSDTTLSGYTGIQYSTDGEHWQNSVPTERNASPYTVYYQYVGDANHENIVGSVEVEIAKAQITITVEADQGMVYGGTEPDLRANVEGKPAGGADVNYTLSRAEGTDAGTYAITVTATAEDNPNYEITIVNENSFRIRPASGYGTVTDEQRPHAVDGTITYDGTAHTLVQGTNNYPDGYNAVMYSVGDTENWSSELPSEANAGDYEIHVKYMPADGNHEAFVDTATISVTIAAADVTLTADDAGKTYGEDDPANFTARITSGSLYGTDSLDYSVSREAGESAGEYAIVITLGTNTNYNVTVVSGTFTIAPVAAPDDDLLDGENKPSANNLTYTGNDQELVTSPATTDYPAGYDTLLYKNENGEWVTDIPEGNDAGNYTVEFRYEDSTGNHDPIEGSVTVPIAPMAAPDADLLSDENKPSANNLTYTGNDQELVTSPSTTNYPDGYNTLLYKNESGQWVPAIPTGNAAGDYTVEFRYEDSTGNRAPIEGTVPVTIAPAAAPNASDVNDNEKPTPINGLTYTGSAQNLVTPPSTLPEGYDQVWYRTDGGNEWSQNIPTGINAKEYEISVKYVDTDGNYEDLTGVTVTGKINPAASALALLTEDNKPHAASGLYWTGDPQVLVVNPSDMPTNYEFIEYSLDNGNTWVTEPAGTEIGTYTIKYRYIDSDGNYQPLTGGSLTSTIYAAQAPEPSTLTDEQKPHAVADLTYDGQTHELVSAPTGTLPNNYEKVMYSTDGGTTWSDAIPAKTSADDYTVNYKYVDTDGAYADLIVPDSIPVSIAPAPAPDVDTLPDDQKPAAIDGLEYTGSAQDLIDRDTPATLPDGYDQIWYSTDGGNTWSRDIPTGTDAGEYEILYKYVDADGDHEDITGGSVTVSIAPADAPSADSLTDANKPSAVDDLAYTGSAQNLVTPPSTLPDGYDQVWYSTDGGNTWSQTIPTGTDAGDYEVSVKYVDSNGNHDDLTGVTVPVTIAPAEAPDASSLTVAQKPTAVNGLAYTGSEQELVNAPSSIPAGYDEVWYSTDGGNTWSQDIPTGIEAGNYTVSVKYVDTDGNYEDLTGITVPVTIAQEAAPELTDAQKPSAVSGLTYTGSAQALVSAPASLPDGYEQVWYSLDGGNTWTQTIPTGTDAGTYTISVRYVDTDGIKADILGPDITVTIAAGTTTAVINGVAQTVTIGSTLARPEDPTRYGYDFTGWFADEACTIPYNFNTPVGVNGVTLYAGWAQVSYSLTEGGESTWNGNSDSTLTFRAVRNRLEPMTFSHFTGIQVDGKDVSKDNYQAKSGSVIVTLNESYLKTLSAGEHTLDIMFDDAPSVRTTFTIVAAQVPSTGESAYSAYSILGALLIASAAAFVIYSARHEEA